MAKSYEITFVKGMNWPKVDTSSWCNPFCVFLDKGMEIKTTHDNNTSDPKWDQSFSVVSTGDLLQIDCYDWEKSGENVLIGKFTIDFADFCDISVNKNIKFDIVLIDSFVSKKKIQDRPAVVVMTITNVEKRKKEVEEQTRKEEEERKKAQFVEENERKEAMVECKRQLREFAEDGLKDKLKTVQYQLMTWTALSNYHITYTTDVDSWVEREVKLSVNNVKNYMFLVIDSKGNLFGTYVDELVDGNSKGSVFLFTLKSPIMGVYLHKYTPKSIEDGIVSLGNGAFFTVKNGFSISSSSCSIENAINQEFVQDDGKEFDADVFVGATSPKTFSARCVFGIQWY
ncbi:hypothetical protein EIN_083280 [Entamoeba invadens IP1]|uniref:hypothetical protein n=1 Tax=Entamoeba invadens IP1 TaxID=370355 RepID=UPI0002C3D1B7|nr:hypothetical protein EIN_083280 [Entamoeba invadens IP1]ELP85206.1 hypothetical protein EIN_083280 [Entamoeba invadens IP1]|eukprot:XP_004184552.1 hypothetical protein EIN_083280 [Entamoeba invadens IP1]